ncbi:MAG: hypothetical protein R6X02_35445 [Enhygromyxa sp.]
MTWHRITPLISCLTLSVLGSACDLGDKSIGNETGADQGELGDTDDEGDEGDEADGEDEGDEQPGFGGSCGEETDSIVEDHDATLPGFDGAVSDYLALVEGSFLGEFSWLPEDGPVSNAHAGTSSPLTITVTYEGGEVRLKEVERVGQFPEDEIEINEWLCSNTLEIDLTLGFATDDGLFAESFQIPIRVQSHTDFAPAGFYFSVDMAALQGQLSLDDFEFAGGEISDMVLIGDFEGDKLDGSFNMEVLAMDWIGFGVVADFQATRTP